MPLSAAGSQLPLTAFFGVRPTTTRSGNRRSTQSKGAMKRKDPAGYDNPAGPPQKKRKSYENLAPRRGKGVQGGDKDCAARNTDTSPESVIILDEDDEPVGEGPKELGLLEVVESPGGTLKSRDRDSGNNSGTVLSSITCTPARRTLAAASLPSPPPTAPVFKRVKRGDYEDHRGKSGPTDADDGPNIPAYGHCVHSGGPSTSGATRAEVVGNKDVIVLRSPHRARDLSMPPPPLPPKVAFLPMPARPFLRTRSASSDKWVPSSQPEESSIPLCDYWPAKQMTGSVPHTPVDQMTQVVPTSQSNERELKISDQLPPLPELYRTPSSPLRRRGSPVSSLISTPENDSGSLEDYLATGPPSPRFVESSQSQTEHEMTSPSVNAMKARHEIFMQSGRDHVLDITSSSPPRPTESQDYDANDEHSESPDSSYPFSFDFLPPRLSPGPVSQYTQSSAPYESYSETPSEVRAFVDMFKGRDEYGNELPAFAGNSGRSCSVSPSPTSQRLEGSSSEKGLQHTRSSSASVSHSYARRSSEPTSHDSPQAVDAQDDAEGSQLDVPPSQEENHPFDSSAIQILPTPVRDFFAMFEENPSS